MNEGMRTTLATEPNSTAREAIKDDLLLKTYAISNLCVCVCEGCKARVGVGYRKRARLQLSVRLADLLEFI